MSINNSRFNPRVPTDFPASLATWRGHWKGKVRNLSTGGMQIERGPTPITPGELVDLKFRLPEHARDIEVQGEVIYLREDHFGIRFFWMTRTEQRALEHFLALQPGAALFL